MLSFDLQKSNQYNKQDEVTTFNMFFDAQKLLKTFETMLILDHFLCLIIYTMPQSYEYSMVR